MLKSFWSLNQDDIFSELHSGNAGITTSLALDRLAEQNKKKKVKSRFRRELSILLKQFTSPLVLLLVAAVILSAFLGDISDVLIILLILIATGLLSFYQERNAGRAVEKLQSMIQFKSKVLRDGKEVTVDPKDVVAGDVLLIESGDIVPADCYIIEANYLHVNEAALTGESYPVHKVAAIIDADAPLAKRKNSLWQGSNIVSGTAKAVVVLTGEETIFGSLSKSISTVTESAFEKGISRFGFFLMRITVVLAFIILILNLLFHRPMIDSVLFALALSIGMTPELLPAIMTIGMSAGAKRMLRKKVIVKNLASIQNLGEINLLCTDKTGTITEGEIKIIGAKDVEGNESVFISKLAFLNAAFESGFPNPIDEAIKKQKQPIELYTKLGEVPFDFIRKRLSIAVNDGKEILLITKGAFKNIVAICNAVLINNEKKALSEYVDNLQKQFMGYSENGFRVIGVCYKNLHKTSVVKEDEIEMIFAGFVLLEDPLKEGIQQILAKLNSMDVQVKVITGDNRFVAAHAAKQLGIPPDKILTGPEIEKLDADALVLKAAENSLFAEIEPNQKEHLILALKKKGSAVAYMGDGINDVAAINAADAGFSVNNAVDIARAAADFVLLEKDLSVLTDGIREGRKTFSNTLKYIFINTGATFGNMFSVAIASLMLPFLPMLPKQILMTNFLTDFPYMAVSSDNVDEEQLQKPGVWRLKQIRNFMILFGIHSSLFDVLTFIALYKILAANEALFQTGWFFESILTELFILFIIRTHKPFIKSIPSKNLILLTILSLIITMGLIYFPLNLSLNLIPLPIKVISILSVIILIYIITGEMLKLWFFGRRIA